MHKRIEQIINWVKHNKSKALIGLSGFVLVCSIGALVPLYLNYSNDKLLNDSYAQGDIEVKDSVMITISNVDDKLSVKKEANELFNGNDTKEFYDSLYKILGEKDSLDYVFQYDDGNYMMDCIVLYESDAITIKLINNKEIVVKAGQELVVQDSVTDYNRLLEELKDARDAYRKENKKDNSILGFLENKVDKPSDIQMAENNEAENGENQNNETASAGETSTDNSNTNTPNNPNVNIPNNNNNNNNNSNNNNSNNTPSTGNTNNGGGSSSNTNNGGGNSGGGNPNPPTPSKPTPPPTPDPAPTPTPDPAPVPQRTWEYMSGMSNELFGLINNYRAQNGLGEIRFDADIHAKAKARAEYNAKNETSGHDVSQISITTGLDSTPQQFLQCWIDSPDHNNYLLNSLLTRGGVAIYKDTNDYYYIVAGIDMDW